MYSLFRYDENVPQYYVQESRDFQMLVRLLTLAVGACKYDADQIQYSNNPDLCSDRTLFHLDGKLGFLPNKEYISSYLREVAKVFARLVRIKGTRKAIVQAVQLFFQAQNLQTSMYVDITNGGTSSEDTDYVINIGMASDVKNTDLLEDILRYILPTGYVTNIFFYDSIEKMVEYVNNYKEKDYGRIAFFTFDDTFYSAMQGSNQLNDIKPYKGFKSADGSELEDIWSKLPDHHSISMQDILLGDGTDGNPDGTDD